MKSEILTEVAEYYSGKLAQHGVVPQGVDWNGHESQLLRFTQLCKIITEPGKFSIIDLGCGYGALLDYLDQHYVDFTYLGTDVSGDMVKAAREHHAAKTHASFENSAIPGAIADFCVASGIMNVRLGVSESDWLAYISEILTVMDKSSRKGFAFNCLSSYSDADKKRDYLYYADPGLIFDICKKNYSRNVSLIHDYGLYEFTMLVRK